ncbi:MAG: transglutaminase-like domain-containing protein [Oscillospiraceae bacterium]|nr:transglutaminase-like domain-containing protein [Oscillospiraceae bacterium]
MVRKPLFDQNHTENNKLIAPMAKRSGKLHKTVIFTGSFLLVLCAAYCTFAALISAFDFPVDMNFLLGIWLPCSLIATAVVMRYRAKGLLALCIPLAIIIFLNYTEIADGAKWSIHTISKLYNKWTPVPILFNDYAAHKTAPTLFFAAAGSVLTYLLVFAISLRRSVFLTILTTLPIASLSFVLISTRPDNIYILGLIAIYVTLLISGAINPDDYMKRALAFIPSFVLSVIFIGFIYLAAPPGTYERYDVTKAIGSYLRNIVQTGPEAPNPLPNIDFGVSFGWPSNAGGNLWMFDTDEVFIADAGERAITNRPLIEINASRSGSFYLRGFSMGGFDGRSWQAEQSAFQTMHDIYDNALKEMPALITFAYYRLPLREGSPHIPTSPPTAEMSVRKIHDVTNVEYIPYYSGIPVINIANLFDFENEGSRQQVQERESNRQFYNIGADVRALLPETLPHMPEILEDQIILNLPENLQGQMILTYSDLISKYMLLDEKTYSATNYPLSQYLNMYKEIDAGTAYALRQMAIEAGIDPNAERSVIVDEVASLIRSSGRYTLTPAQIPEDADFALYFLQTLKEGYCIHFATAATLMLRSLDIPARFTSGFAANVSLADVGENVILTDENAHAWVEVFYDDVGWMYLEVTPSIGNAAIPAPQIHTPPRQIEEVTPTPFPFPFLSPTPLPEDGSPPPGGTTPEIDTPPQNPDGNQMNGQSGDGVDPGDRRQIFLPEWFVNVIVFLASMAAIALAIVAHRHILRAIRQKRFTQRNTNAAVICMWRHISKISRRETLIPTDIEELALKARFSEHSLTSKEREHMLRYTKRLAYDLLRSRGDFGWLWSKYILGL